MKRLLAVAVAAALILAGCADGVPTKEDKSGDFTIPESATLESTNYGNTLGTRVFQLWHVDMPYEETVEFFKRNTPENPNPGHNFKWQRELNENEYGWCWENKPGDSEYRETLTISRQLDRDGTVFLIELDGSGDYKCSK